MKFPAGGKALAQLAPRSSVSTEVGAARVSTPRRQGDAQLRYLSHATFLEEAGTPIFLNCTALAACLCVAGFLGWAGLTEVSEVSHAPGEVVPSGFEQVVQHMDGGLVKTINVKTGDTVEPGQLLLTVDDGSTTDNLERSKSKLVHLAMTAVRLRALFDGIVPEWSGISGATAHDAATQQRLYQSAIEDLSAKEGIVREQIQQRKTAIGMLTEQRTNAEKSLAIAKRIKTSREALYEKKLLAYPLLAKAEQDVIQIESDDAKLKDQIKQGSESIVELNQRLKSLHQSSRLDLAAKLNETVSEIKQVESTIEQLRKRFDRLELKAPVRGIVKSLQVNTIGSVLSAGQTVMTIVPIDEELVVEAQIPPRDIGYVRPGQPVQVKVSAYDFSRYGVVKGTLERVSASAFQGRAGEHYYRARIKLSKSYVGSRPGQNAIIPGMTAMADIQTGRKTVLDYLLKPVQAAAATAFSER
jgi:HlyD family secretion protein/adhesin transport system membrane fusion protein